MTKTAANAAMQLVPADPRWKVATYVFGLTPDDGDQVTYQTVLCWAVPPVLERPAFEYPVPITIVGSACTRRTMQRSSIPIRASSTPPGCTRMQTRPSSWMRCASA